MERRVQCLERIVREQQQEMERLIGMVLTRNVPIDIGFQSNTQSVGTRVLTASTGVIPRFDTEIPNQNFYFHDEVTQPQAAAGKEVAIRHRKTPLVKDLSWDAKKKVASFVEKKDKAPEGVHAFTRALPIQHTINPKIKPNLRVPMKQSRAVNAAKDFIDYIATKESIIVKAASGARSSSGPSYSANSRSIQQSGPTAPSATSRNRKKIAAPTVEINAKKTSLTPEKNIDRRNQARSAPAGRTTFISNFDRDNLNNNGRTTFLSNSDRRTFISNSDRNLVDNYADRDPYVYNAERNAYPPNNDNRAFIDNSDRYSSSNYVDRNAFVGNSAHRPFNYGAERNVYPSVNNDNRTFIDNSDRYSSSNYVDRNAFVGNSAHRPFNNGVDRNTYSTNTDQHFFMSNTDRNALSSSAFVGNVNRIPPLGEPDRGVLKNNFNYEALDSTAPIVIDDGPSRSSVSVNSDRNADRVSHVSSYQQPVINLTMTSIGSKRKEKEKATEEGEMNKKKPAALRQSATTVTAAVVSTTIPSRLSSAPTSSAISSSSSSSIAKAKSPSPTSIHPPTTSHTSSSSSIISRKSESSSSSSSSSSNSTSSSSSSSSYSTAYPSYSSSRPSTKPSSSSKTSSQILSSSRSSTQVPSAISAKQSKSGSSTRSESNFQDMTGDESDNESENEQDRQKIKKVLTLIQSLTSLSDRQQMAEQLLDKFKTKPAKTKKLINAAKEIFQEWLVEEVLNFSEETNVQLVEMMLKVADKATWTPGDISRLRVDRTIRQCYKACSALFGASPSSFPPCTNLINLTKEMWPKYRQMYKMYNSNTTALRNTVDSFKDARDYWQ